MTSCSQRKPVVVPLPQAGLTDVFRHNNLGVALMDNGDYAEAAEEFRAALKIWSSCVTARVNLGIALFYDKKHDAAQKELEAALQLQPDHPRAHYVLGLLSYYGKARHDQAAQHFAAVAQADPHDAWTHYYLGLSLMRLSRFKDAAAALRRAVQIEPGNVAFRYQLSLALRRSGQTREADREQATFAALRATARGQSATPGTGYLEQGKYAEAVAETKQPIADFGFRISELNTPHAPRKTPEVTGDYDNDGIEDRLQVKNGKVVLLRRDPRGRSNVVPLTPAPDRVTAAAFADVDHDGDLDIYVCCDGQPNRLFRNSGGKFVEIAKQAKVDGGNARSLGVVFADFNNDRAVDFCVANADSPPFLFLNNRDGTFAERTAPWGLNKQASSRAIAAGDVNHDGYPDLFFAPGAGGRAGLFLNDKGAGFRDSPHHATRSMQDVTACGFLDADADGDLDLVCDTRFGRSLTLPPPPHATRFFRNDFIRSAGRNWLEVKVRGRIKPQVLSNFSGIGAKVEVRAAGLWLKREVQATTNDLCAEGSTLRFGLGDVKELDYVRVVFPSGVRLTKQSVKANQTIVMDEPAGKYTSCPMVYAWNGKRFEFIADTLGGGVIGEWEAPNKWLHSDPDEWLKIDGEKLQPQDGAYVIQIVNQLEEVDLFDTVHLVAVDHPAEVEVFPDERLLCSLPPKGSADEPQPLTFYVVHAARPPLTATDEHGHDVLPLLAKKDGRYHDDFELLPYRGFAKTHSLTLVLRIADFGLRDKSTRNTPYVTHPTQPVLLLHGWTDWASSSSLFAAWQAGITPLPMKLEVANARGEWQTAVPDIGIPAGTPRTIVVPLEVERWHVDRLARCKVRITTNMAVYWDEIRLGLATKHRVGMEAPPLQTHRLPLINADLHWIGYPQPVTGHRSLVTGHSTPPTYDYHSRAATAEWGTHRGAYTRFGDVRELLRQRDDKFVIMGHGEEITLRFDAGRMPALRRGWKRDFFLYTDGYGKDMDVNSAYPFTVEPLPFHAMTRYPFADGEQYPMDAEHLEYLLGWNTRWQR
ncbi:MAG: FG-GAP-like repeat-containing protein [Abditibacteriales bacterium]|nr:FG-GAP-like repeat-containing protein [Abditibacteriales bacterium]MDW8367558.1 FG-GAP-like repeat-containing protein [Abditibacteriales bacterium]